MSALNISSTQAGYAAVAEDYAAKTLHELDGKPLDCELLERLAAKPTGELVDR